MDSPRSEDPPTHSVLVQGWVAIEPGSVWEGAFIDTGELRPLDLIPRPDVEAHFAGWQVAGYQAALPITPESAGRRWSVVFRIDGNEYRDLLPFEPSASALDEFRAIKRKKLERVEPLLRCPRPVPGGAGVDCHGELRAVDEATLECTRCGTRYGRTAEQFDMLPSELALKTGIEHTDNISAWGYDPYATDIIQSHADGLVLDAGSGFKQTLYEHVVDAEIVAYPSTDVLSVGEHLPFADGAFDAALSLNVLEHVRDPFRCAQELARVVRPGGKLYTSVPFLQPYHGFPHHYYNMTESGLRNLFGDTFEVDTLAVPAPALPIWTLSWFLNSYVAGLPTDVAARFQDLKVGDLMGPGESYLHEDFVAQLRASTNTELACGFILLGTRRDD
ncbi:MAG TPA: class I SAM-dependent methyltransferase [Acidimicrobiia bacterium]